ncbi:hypothetical protein [Marixanthomonas spongiae]|uniref:Uncharacterized protein n=1 Tax=Marixanthomonas spongiae TaxID=2174845 RepID=A0A2U0HVF1_9FLAO|nr:hypothetical protein [Marixanthomonas spongiae]PVW12853.1 hypothetical protein DDV96_14610 [Marixanthomonas spongiae]
MPLLVSKRELNSNYLINNTYENLAFKPVTKIANITFIPPKTKIKFSNYNNWVYLKLDSSNNETLSVLRLKKIILNKEKFYEANKSISFKKRKGYAQCLYEYAFQNLDLPIICDGIQTKPGSSDLWLKFQKRQDEYGYEIVVFNTQTNHKSKFIRRNYNEYDIWGWYADFTDMAKNIPKFLEDAVSEGDMELELYQFLKKNINKVKDRSHIRLIGRKN